MSLLDLHGEDALAALPQRIDTPKAPARFSAWSAVPRGVGEAGLQVGATAADAWNAFKAMRDATPEQRKQMDRTGVPVEAFSSSAGDRLRDAGRELRPDPVDASAAEQVLYGFARGATKIVAGAVAGGLPGVLAAGAEEGVTQADELRRAGVDLKARTKAGAVQGAGMALAALPAAGQTLAATAGLYLAGGPGGFVAQQALTREILKRGGYDKQAEQFDPFDPVGLAVSALIPAPFAAYGLRANRRAAAAKAAEDFRAGPVPSEQTPVAQAVQQAMPREVVDAAMVSHLTETRQRADAAAGLMAGESRPVQSLAQFIDVGRWKAIDPPSVPPVPDEFLAWVRNHGGVSLDEKFDITGERSGVLSNPGGIFRRGGMGTDELASRAVESGFLLPEQAGQGAHMIDLLQRRLRGEPVLSASQIELQAERTATLRGMEDRLTDLEGRLRLLGEDPAAARGNPDAMQAYIDANQHRLLAAALDEAAARPDAEDSPHLQALRERARQIAADMFEADRTVAQYEAEVHPLSPVMRRLVQEAQQRAPTTPQAPNPEAAAPARGAGTPPPAGAAEPGGSAGVEAAGVAPRQDIDGQPVASTTADQAEGAAVQARLQALQIERPDMQVMLDGMDKPMRLADFLAAVKAEADEMKADAPLVEMAAQCALINGL